MGMANDVLSAFAASQGSSYEPTDAILAIPQNEINISQGFLKQNPGY